MDSAQQLKEYLFNDFVEKRSEFRKRIGLGSYVNHLEELLKREVDIKEIIDKVVEKNISSNVTVNQMINIFYSKIGGDKYYYLTELEQNVFTFTLLD